MITRMAPEEIATKAQERIRWRSDDTSTDTIALLRMVADLAAEVARLKGLADAKAAWDAAADFDVRDDSSPGVW